VVRNASLDRIKSELADFEPPARDSRKGVRYITRQNIEAYRAGRQIRVSVLFVQM
jgi:hypothetical protein